MTSVLDLPEVEPGDWGWCLCEPMNDGEPWQLVYYDDDESECSEGIEEEHKCDDDDGDCYLDLRAIVYQTDDIGGAHRIVPHDMLRTLPRQYIESSPSDGGSVYAISLIPELDIGRLKVGYTARSIEHRLAQYRTANPTAILLGLWPGGRDAEHIAHAALSGRLGSREVFQVNDVAAALDAIDRALRRQP